MISSKNLGAVLALILVAAAPPTLAVEVLPVEALASQCRELTRSADSPGARFCAHYVRGFIDGAVATDVRVMRNVEAEYEQRLSITERAARTRMPGWHERNRAAQYAEFCLGDPVPLSEVVAVVAQHLAESAAAENDELPAREAVYGALRANYPC